MKNRQHLQLILFTANYLILIIRDPHLEMVVKRSKVKLWHLGGFAMDLSRAGLYPQVFKKRICFFFW